MISWLTARLARALTRGAAAKQGTPTSLRSVGGPTHSGALLNDEFGLRSEDEQDREFVKRTHRLHIAPHLCSRCKRRPRLVGYRICGWCRTDDRDRFADEGGDPYGEVEAA